MIVLLKVAVGIAIALITIAAKVTDLQWLVGWVSDARKSCLASAALAATFVAPLVAMYCHFEGKSRAWVIAWSVISVISAVTAIVLPELARSKIRSGRG